MLNNTSTTKSGKTPLYSLLTLNISCLNASALAIKEIVLYFPMYCQLSPLTCAQLAQKKFSRTARRVSTTRNVAVGAITANRTDRALSITNREHNETPRLFFHLNKSMCSQTGKQGGDPSRPRKIMNGC